MARPSRDVSSSLWAEGRNHKELFVVGDQIGIPHLEKPNSEDVDG